MVTFVKENHMFVWTEDVMRDGWLLAEGCGLHVVCM